MEFKKINNDSNLGTEIYNFKVDDHYSSNIIISIRNAYNVG